MKKILIIDDEPDVAFYLKTLLEDHGYTTMSAHEAGEGLKLACMEQPDLLCLDIMMPKKSGIALYKEIKENESLKHIPVVIISGVESAHSFKGHKFRKLIPDQSIPEPVAFFEKPVNIPSFLNLVSSILDESTKDSHA